MTEERIARLNTLARKGKAEGLTPAEKQEQTLLREEYLNAVRQSLEVQLDQVYLLNEDGTKQKLQKKSDS